MEDKIKRLGDAELEIMLIIWAADGPVTSTYIQERLIGRRSWALSTLMSTLTRLAEKGFVDCDRSTRTNYYSALLNEEEYKAKESRGFLEKLHGNSVTSLITSLYDSSSIDDNALSELRELLDELGGRDSDG